MGAVHCIGHCRPHRAGSHHRDNAAERACRITSLRVTERGEVYNPGFRFLSRFVFGHHRSSMLPNALVALSPDRVVEFTIRLDLSPGARLG